jgi:hypothetical protein
MKITEQHKKEIEALIAKEGGPYSTISLILKQTGPLYSKNRRTTEFVLSSLDYIVSIRHISFGAINDIVIPYNIYYLDNKFHLVD